MLSMLIALTIREATHAKAAKTLGDPTAFLLKRTSLNPIVHIDPIGRFLIPFFTILSSGIPIGWAKSNTVNEHNFKNPKIDNILVAISGPLANFLFAMFLAFIIIYLSKTSKTHSELTDFAIKASTYGVHTNLALTIFNLIPLPPLDGAIILSSMMSKRIKYIYFKLTTLTPIIILTAIISISIYNLQGKSMFTINLYMSKQFLYINTTFKPIID